MLRSREIRRMVDGGYSQSQVAETVFECLQRHSAGEPGGIDANEFSLREMYEELVPDGREAVRLLNPRYESAAMEANVDTSLFANITGQLVVTRILEGFNNGDYTFSRLIPAQPSPFLGGEKIPGMAQLGDTAAVVAEGDPYGNSTFGEEYIETPATTKRGRIVAVTKEAVFADRTRLILDRARGVGEFLGLNKEKRLCDVAIGATNNYKRNGVSADTYQAATPWINEHSNVLTDWGNVEAAEILMGEVTDPNTGEPISLSGTSMVVTRAKYRTAQRIVTATQVRHSGGGVETIGGNPIQSVGYQVHMSDQMYMRLQSEKLVSAANAKLQWLYGNFSKAFAYMENWPITTVQAPPDATLNFTNDIVAQYKASERGVAAVLEPRYIQLNLH